MRECFPKGKEDADKRKVWRCTLPVVGGAEVIRKCDWPEDGEYPPVHMGKLPDPNSEDVEEQKENPYEGHDQGCPGGWYRCAFTDSLRAFEPLQSEGGYQGCYELEQADSRLIHEWVRLLQIEQSRQAAYEQEQWSPKSQG